MVAVMYGLEISREPGAIQIAGLDQPKGSAQ